MTTTTYVASLAGVGPVDVTVDERGEGQPFLLLHGGGGPPTVSSFAELFATTHPARVLSPIHPGFGATSRPEALKTVPQLADLYVALLELLELKDVTVVGNSIGGWIAAEIGVIESPRVSGIVIIDGTGIEVPDHPVADFFSLTLDQVFQLSYYNPEPFRFDPTSLPPAAQAIAAGNRAALAVYAGTAMTDHTLKERLSTMETPALLLWGDSDQIVDPDYGRTYAATIPRSRFQLLKDTGHMPQIETPDQVLKAIWECADTDFSTIPADG
jgi:pimeloyl-ACP methyl ester carboxylesterase